MKLRPGLLSVISLTTAACVICLAGYVYRPHNSPLPTASWPQSSASANLVDHEHPFLRFVPSRSKPHLKWSPMEALADLPQRPQPKSNHRRQEVAITRIIVPPPLNLRLPLLPPQVSPVLPLSRSALAHPHHRSTTNPTSAGTTAAVLHTNATDPTDFLSQASHLFNHSNGLRGFMAENWLNKRVGLQGGVAIKDQHLRDENSDLRDNMAVGMGVLLAF